MKNHYLSLKKIAQGLDMSYESIRIILVYVLGMKRVVARLVPEELDFIKKEHRKSDPTFMKDIITGDETWVYGFVMQISR